MDDNALEVIRQAERIVWAAGWHIQEQSVLEELAGTPGLARARLEPRSDVIQLVSYDGEHLGHVRREGPPGPDEHWVAVLKQPGAAGRHLRQCRRRRGRARPGLRQDDQEHRLKRLRGHPRIPRACGDAGGNPGLQAPVPGCGLARCRTMIPVV